MEAVSVLNTHGKNTKSGHGSDASSSISLQKLKRQTGAHITYLPTSSGSEPFFTELLRNHGTILDRIQAPRAQQAHLISTSLLDAVTTTYLTTMKFEMAATLALTATTSAFVVPSIPLSTRVASSASSTSMMAGERSKSLPMLPQPPAVREKGRVAGRRC